MALHPTRQFLRANDDDPTKCILWVGAGLSASNVREGAKGLPDWHTLMQRMIEDLRDSGSCEPANGSIPFRVERNDLISPWPARTDERADA